MGSSGTMGVAELLARAAALWPSAVAVRFEGAECTYAEIAARVAVRCEGLSAWGVGRGARVALLADNGPAFLEVYFAAAALGAALVPLNTRLAATELAEILDDCEPRVLLAEPSFGGLAREAHGAGAGGAQVVWLATPPGDGLRAGESVERIAPSDRPDRPFTPEPVEPEELAQLYYTSGTTGRAKGVMLSHENVVRHALAAAIELELTERDVWAHVAPMFHLADAWATFAITLVGGVHVFLPRFDAGRALDLLESERVTLSNLVPTMLGEMVALPGAGERDWSALRLVLSGGAPIAPETVARIRETFSSEYVQTYGMTETSPYLTLSRLTRAQAELPRDERLRLSARTGRPFLGVELEVVDEQGRRVPCDDATVGEIRVRGVTVTRGYWRRPDATAEAIREGWLYTGDLATVDRHGFVEIRDRKKDMILSGGENVYSIEVENALYSHPEVLEAAAFGRPDPKWGERVCAAVVLREGANVDAQALLEHCRARLAGFKLPREIEFHARLPRTGSGKLAKRLLR
jgi:fatty-acyl-CoA synthase